MVGLLYVQAGSGKSDAQARLNAANAQKARVAARRRPAWLTSRHREGQVDAARASLKAAMGSEVLWSSTLDNLRLRLPDGVRYQSIAVTAIRRHRLQGLPHRRRSPERRLCPATSWPR